VYSTSYTLKTLSGLVGNTYLLAVAAAVLFILLAMLIANLIAYEGGKKPRDAFRRRVWFWVLCLPATLSFFLWNYFYVLELVKGAPAQNKFLQHNIIATVVVLVLYIALGFVFSKIMKRRKFGTVFN